MAIYGEVYDINHKKLFIEAIDAVGRKKPKFPFTSVTQSALLFVSIYLKASNPNMTEYTRMKWTEILDQFNNDCDNISFLGRKMTRRYRAPSQVSLNYGNSTLIFNFSDYPNSTPDWQDFSTSNKNPSIWEKSQVNFYIFKSIFLYQNYEINLNITVKIKQTTLINHKSM